MLCKYILKKFVFVMHATLYCLFKKDIFKNKRKEEKKRKKIKKRRKEKKNGKKRKEKKFWFCNICCIVLFI